MLSDRHHNIFYYYRGQSSKASASEEAKEHAYHRQVEDNTTKALINVLKHGNRGLTKSFVERFVPQASIDWRTKPKHYLQGHPEAASEDAWLLGISVLGEIAERPVPRAGHGRVDAALHYPGSTLVGIEVKTVDCLDPDQLLRHAKDLEIVSQEADDLPGDARVCRACWTDVYRWASDAANQADDAKSRFLLQQFGEYLQLVSLYIGFGAEHFKWLGRPEDDPNRSWEIQKEIRTQLSTIWTAIREPAIPECLRSDELLLLGEIDRPNQLPMNAHVAAMFSNRGESDHVNVCIELTPCQLQVNLVGWTQSQAKRLADSLAPPPARTIRSEALAEDLELAVFRRRPEGDKRWNRGVKEIFEQMPCHRVADLAGKPINEVLDEQPEEWRTDPDSRWVFPAYHLRRAWPRDYVVGIGSRIVPEVAEAVRGFLPLLGQINQ